MLLKFQISARRSCDSAGARGRYQRRGEQQAQWRVPLLQQSFLGKFLVANLVRLCCSTCHFLLVVRICMAPVPCTVLMSPCVPTRSCISISDFDSCWKWFHPGLLIGRPLRALCCHLCWSVSRCASDKSFDTDVVYYPFWGRNYIHRQFSAWTSGPHLSFLTSEPPQ